MITYALKLDLYTTKETRVINSNKHMMTLSGPFLLVAKIIKYLFHKTVGIKDNTVMIDPSIITVLSLIPTVFMTQICLAVGIW